MTKLSVAFASIAMSLSIARAAPTSVEGCRAITDGNLRLACYDAMPLPGSSAAAAPAAQAEPTHLPAASDPSQFGLESRSPAERVEEVVSRVPGVFEGWNSKTRFRLENGQVWQVVDGSRADYYLADPVVRVRRGLLGNYVMEIEGVNQVIRVRRVQ